MLLSDIKINTIANIIITLVLVPVTICCFTQVNWIWGYLGLVGTLWYAGDSIVGVQNWRQSKR